MTATVIKMSIQRMVCVGCGAEANASCNCGLNYAPKAVRAAEAVKANPEKSNRAIAAEIGADEKTVRKARADQSAPVTQVTPDATVTGRDGKQYPAKQKPEAVDEPEDDDNAPTPEDYVKLLSDYWKLKDRNTTLTAALNAQEAQASRNWPEGMTAKQIKHRDKCLTNIAVWQRDLEQLYGEVTGCPSWRVEITTKDGRRMGNGARLGTRGEAEFYKARIAAEQSESDAVHVIACENEKANVSVAGDSILFKHGDCVLFNWRSLEA
jgi:hypothetical protein